MQNCQICTKRGMWHNTGNIINGRVERICRNCGHIQLEEPPQGLAIPPKVLYFDIETALMRVTTFGTGRQYVGWKSIEQDSFVICWGAAWLDNPKKIISNCVTPEQAKRHDDHDCLWNLWELMDAADYVCGHNLKNFDWKFVHARFIEHGWGAPHDTKIVDTLSLSRGRFRVSSHSLEAWSKKLNGNPKADMRREDWENCLRGDPKALRKMHNYCRGDIREGVNVTLKFQEYYESATGKLLFK